MNIAGLRSIGSAVLLVLLAGAGCNRPKRASSESSAAPTPQGVRASITAHAPDAFYDPPSDLSRQPGALLRSGPLKDVILPAGMRGWRILYATTVDDSTPATAVATVFAPTDPPAGPRPVITWEHGTTGLLQKCMPSLLSAPTEGIPGCDRIVMAGWVVVATDYSFAEKGGPHPYLIGEAEARAALDSVRAARQMSELTLDKRVSALRMTPHHHAFVERKLGHLSRGTDRVERCTRFGFADEVRMRAALLCERVICRDHDPASHYDPVAFGDALGRQRQKRRHSFMQQARCAVLTCDERTCPCGRVGRREHGRDRRRWRAVVQWLYKGCASLALRLAVSRPWPVRSAVTRQAFAARPTADRRMHLAPAQ